MNEDQIELLVKEALCTDGAHHKQWYLEQILKLMGWTEKDLSYRYWEEGIAP